jgi:hypothetical protein
MKPYVVEASRHYEDWLACSDPDGASMEVQSVERDWGAYVSTAMGWKEHTAYSTSLGREQDIPRLLFAVMEKIVSGDKEEGEKLWRALCNLYHFSSAPLEHQEPSFNWASPGSVPAALFVSPIGAKEDEREAHAEALVRMRAQF